jgi:hypothetical protein
MKSQKQTNLLPVFVASILTFATKDFHNVDSIERDNVISQIDYYARSYAKEKGFDYENLTILESDFSDLSIQENALLLAHNLTNPKAQTKDDIKINLICCKSFLKTL